MLITPGPVYLVPDGGGGASLLPLLFGSSLLLISAHALVHLINYTDEQLFTQTAFTHEENSSCYINSILSGNLGIST